jgi:hypothetical protein
VSVRGGWSQAPARAFRCGGPRRSSGRLRRSRLPRPTRREVVVDRDGAALQALVGTRRTRRKREEGVRSLAGHRRRMRWRSISGAARAPRSSGQRGGASASMRSGARSSVIRSWGRAWSSASDSISASTSPVCGPSGCPRSAGAMRSSYSGRRRASVGRHRRRGRRRASTPRRWPPHRPTFTRRRTS